MELIPLVTFRSFLRTFAVCYTEFLTPWLSLDSLTLRPLALNMQDASHQHLSAIQEEELLELSMHSRPRQGLEGDVGAG